MKRLIMVLFLCNVFAQGDGKKISVTSRDGNWRAESSGDQYMHLWCLIGRPNCYRTISTGNESIRKILVSLDQRYIALLLAGDTIKIWDNDTNEFRDAFAGEGYQDLVRKITQVEPRYMVSQKIRGLQAKFIDSK